MSSFEPFWNYLTFMKFYHKEYILGSKRVLFTRDLKAQSTFAAWNPCWFFVESKVEIFWDCHKKLKKSPSQFWRASFADPFRRSYRGRTSRRHWARHHSCRRRPGSSTRHAPHNGTIPTSIYLPRSRKPLHITDEVPGGTVVPRLHGAATRVRDRCADTVQTFSRPR